jgi:hypothetical protein
VLAVAVGMAWQLVWRADELILPIPRLRFRAHNLLAGLTNAVTNAQVILAVWVIQAVLGRWRAAPEWPDRLGRVVAAYWFIAALTMKWALRFMG